LALFAVSTNAACETEESRRMPGRSIEGTDIVRFFGTLGDAAGGM
jgi:hypothetical protein